MLIDFRELFPRYNIQPKGVLHVGANIGEEAPVYLELGIKRQVWIEANPEIFLKLKANISNNPEAVAFNFAAGDENKLEVPLHVSNNGSQSSSVLELGTHKIAHPDVYYVKDVNVQMWRLHDFLDLAYPPYSVRDWDFLNIDVQGFELNVLRGLGVIIDQFKWIYLEVNREELYKGCALIDSLDLFMTANRFKRVETKWAGNTGWGDALYIR